MKLLFVLTAASALAATPVSAQTFDFESLASTSGGAYTSLSQTNSGLTMTLSRAGGLGFDISSAVTPSFGSRSLSPFANPGSGPFTADFSSDLSFISVDMGDFAPSDSDTFTLSIFSGLGGTGTLLGSSSFAYGSAGFPTTGTLTAASLVPFRSAIFNGGSNEFPNSVYYDNIVARPTVAGVPEPSTWAMLLLGFGLIGGAMRRRRAAKTTVTFA